MVLLTLVLVVVVGSVVAATYLWLSKREERMMEKERMTHEREMHLDDLAFDDTPLAYEDIASEDDDVELRYDSDGIVLNHDDDE